MMDGNEDEDILEFLENEYFTTEDFLYTSILNIVSDFTISNLCSSPSRTSEFSGAEYIQELLSCGHNAQIKEVL
jgi:hypothetical protein